MIRIIVVEDEAVALRRILNFLEGSPIPNVVINTADSISQTVEILTSDTDFDLLLLDIHLSDGNSFEIFNQVEVTKPVIFITAYDEYALQAFKKISVDYLLKPLKKEELWSALQKFETHYLGNEKADTLSSGIQKDSRYLINVGTHIRTVEKKDVAFYFSSSKITYLVTFEGKKFPLEQPLEQIEETVGPDFFRVNRQFIVHRNSIQNMQKHTKSRVKLQLKGWDESIIISTEKSPSFKIWLKG